MLTNTFVLIRINLLIKVTVATFDDAMYNLIFCFFSKAKPTPCALTPSKMSQGANLIVITNLLVVSVFVVVAKFKGEFPQVLPSPILRCVAERG